MQKQTANLGVPPEGASLEAYGVLYKVPDQATLHRLLVHAKNLKKNHRDWSTDKLYRKTAEAFKLQKRSGTPV